MSSKLYYFENDRLVFTPEYHIERGYCCGSGCRHCPYDPQHTRNNKKLNQFYLKSNIESTINSINNDSMDVDQFN